MAKTSFQNSDNNFSTTDNPLSEELKELRSLILKPEQIKIQQLEDRLDNPKLHANDLSRDLPQAIVLSTRQDDKLKVALMPTVEGIVKASVRKDLKVFADALFPVIGPAIRKAISETFKSMVQSINKTLEQSVSWKGIKWRIEALRTGKSFGEIVVSHTLVYRVEQVFLIHGESGILLNHVIAEFIKFQDADMVSGMLKAIQDFVQDSFATKQGETLNIMEVGELSVWIEKGPQCLLAAVIRGIPPKEIRTVLQNSLENIHLEKSDVLESFSGETSVFEDTRHLLENCLLSKDKEKTKKTSPIFWLFIIIVIIVLSGLSFFTIRNQIMWRNYKVKLIETPGIVVTSVRHKNGKSTVFGLRDPLAMNPIDLLKDYDINPDKVSYKLESFQSFDNEILLKRIKKILQPPESVNINISNESLILAGSAENKWINETNQLLKTMSLPISINDSLLINSDEEKFESKYNFITVQHIPFEHNKSNISNENEIKLSKLVSETKELLGFAEKLNKNIHIEISGFADNTGNEKLNLRLSRKRAEKIYSYFIENGVSAEKIKLVGRGVEIPTKQEIVENTNGIFRCVTFSVFINGKKF